uniref:Uncharacterized protein n=1 Tax=Ditylenchus dipsaci TaxID=166011 RepID=A0A915E1G5_9BILA
MALRQEIRSVNQAARVLHARNELRLLQRDERRMNRISFRMIPISTSTATSIVITSAIGLMSSHIGYWKKRAPKHPGRARSSTWKSVNPKVNARGVQERPPNIVLDEESNVFRRA